MNDYLIETQSIDYNDENIQKIQLCQLTWDSFFDIYKNKNNLL